jgi:tellurite methyltransferase
MLPTRNINYGNRPDRRSDTFVVDREERYCDAPTLIALFAGFELLSLKQQQQQQQHRKPGSWHWHIVAERRRQ